MRTARSRISGEYLLDLFITPSSQEMEPPTNPGRFTDSKAPASLLRTHASTDLNFDRSQ